MTSYSASDTRELMKTIEFFSDPDNVNSLEQARKKYAPDIAPIKDVVNRLAQIADPLDKLDRFISGDLTPEESKLGLDIANGLKNIKDPVTIIGNENAPAIIAELNAARSSFSQATEELKKLSSAISGWSPQMNALREKFTGIKPTVGALSPEVMNDSIRQEASAVMSDDRGYLGRLRMLTTEFTEGGFVEKMPRGVDDLDQAVRESMDLSHSTGPQKNPFTLESELNKLIHAAHEKAQSYPSRGDFRKGM